jgi:hypothetical protein
LLGSTAAAISASELRQFGEVDRDPPRPVLKLCRDHQCQYRLKLADIDLRIVSSLFGNDAMRSATTQMPRWATYMGSMTQRDLHALANDNPLKQKKNHGGGITYTLAK